MAITTPPTGTSNAEIIRWAFEALSRRDVSALRQVWTEETVERFPDRTCHGADEIAAYFEDAFTAVGDWHMEVLAVAENGDDVFVRWHLTGTHAGALLGIAATGKPLAIDGVDHIVMRDGKITKNFIIVDQMQYARQIGMMPADGSSGDKAVKAAFNAATNLRQRIGR